MDAADGRLVAGVVEWLFREVLLDVRFNRPIKIVVDPAGNLVVCGRADVRRKKRQK